MSPSPLSSSSAPTAAEHAALLADIQRLETAEAAACRLLGAALAWRSARVNDVDDRSSAADVEAALGEWRTVKPRLEDAHATL